MECKWVLENEVRTFVMVVVIELGICWFKRVCILGGLMMGE